MLMHLFNNYGIITALDLQENYKHFTKPWDPSTPFSMLVDQIKEAMDMAEIRQQPYTVQQVLNMAYNLVLNTGMFFEDLKK